MIKTSSMSLGRKQRFSGSGFNVDVAAKRRKRHKNLNLIPMITDSCDKKNFSSAALYESISVLGLKTFNTRYQSV
jgi:hypothetical protein